MPLIPPILSLDVDVGIDLEYNRQFDIVKLRSENISDSDIPILHLSPSRLDRLTARVPRGYFTRTGDEENTFKRISFAPDIDHCILALGHNVENKLYYVYEPEDYDKLKIVRNDFLVKHRLVIDANITKELWAITPVVKVICVGEIKIGKAINNRFETFEYQDEDKDDGSLLRANAYYYNWDWKRAYHIRFPTSEAVQLADRLNKGLPIVTSRISDEMHRYKVFDVLTTNITDRRLVVTKVKHFSDIKEHPYYSEVTKAQMAVLTEAGEFDVVWLRVK